MTASINL